MHISTISKAKEKECQNKWRHFWRSTKLLWRKWGFPFQKVRIVERIRLTLLIGARPQSKPDAEVQLGMLGGPWKVIETMLLGWEACDTLVEVSFLQSLLRKRYPELGSWEVGKCDPSGLMAAIKAKQFSHPIDSDDDDLPTQY